MGCASSAALPFLSGQGHQAVAESPRLNGHPPYELKMVNNKLKDDPPNIKDINETFVSEKIKDVVDSSAVQGIIGGVVHAKDNIVNQIQGAGESMVHGVTSAMETAEGKIESAFGQLTNKLDEVEEKVKSGVDDMESKLHEGMETVEGKVKELKKTERENDIDELLATLPEGGDVKQAAEDAIENTADQVEKDSE